jgi:SAM-dependent methyltransferase
MRLPARLNSPRGVRKPVQSQEVSRRYLLFLLLSAAVLQAQTPPDRRRYWDELFHNGKISFNKDASKLLQYAITERKPGLAIDLGMGEGRNAVRNAVLLASKGWHVTGVDFSEVAVRQARTRAAATGVSIDAIVEDLDRFELGRARWDLIALFYMHGWSHESRRNVPRLLTEALKPGGLLVIEGYAGDKGAYQTNELLRRFDGLKIVYYQDALDEADWAPGEKSRLVRFIAEKPNE